MRKIYLWSISLFTILVGAQERYEAFGVNNKYGIVEIQNQKEYVAPDFSDINLLVTDYLALQNGNQVSFYSRETGEKTVLDKVKWQNVYLNDKKYEHFQDANNSYLIADRFKEKIILPRKYSAVDNQFFKEGRKYFVGVHDHKLDIYKSSDITKPLIKDVKASGYFTDFYTKTGTTEVKQLHIFYGEGMVNVYNDHLKPIKSYKGNAAGLGDLNDIMEKDYKQVLRPPSVSNVFAGEFWWKGKSTGGKTKIWNRKNLNKSFVINGDYGIWDIKYNNQWIDLRNEDRTKLYKFRVDMENKRIILPQKYQEELSPVFSD
ncbi:hypothetical protein [Elizabethkingia ursingii]|uniref:Uncharacterized protein n=1 Tax=Elizabethkingia ursingii TaxID=1756150 RepID=A0AAJ3NA50_9FLAO|nr:hypothetical protein [Elizabethkingia ursingii]AQX10371.1 hypothetical protein BBD34_17790 [Elizabethkingia ursingii]KUY31076.1 hypothetical protein ATB96_12135 [Elizabethkingia ursingii]OPB72499.1 hypothetical protein BAY32_13190 [Elizabethkingia ursingii]